MKSKNFFRLLLCTYAVILVGLSLYPFDEMESFTVSGLDKISHVIMYFIFGFLLGLSFSQSNRWLLLLCSIGFGVVMEICQETLTTTRMFDYLDILANIIGSLIGIWLFVLVMKKSEIID